MPPARKWRWTLIALPAALFLTVVPVSLWRASRSENPFEAVAYHVIVLLFAGLLSLAVLRLESRSRRKLRGFLSSRFPNDFIVMMHSSGEFEDSIEAITGDDPSPGAPRSWTIGFVDRGTTFELWHLDRGKPRLLMPFPWGNVTAVSVGKADTYDTWERAVVITVGIDGRHFQIPVTPLREDDLLQRPARDDRFAEVLTHIRTAHATSA